MNYQMIDNNELYHFGVKGMKWGVRRYQNKDGSLTSLGKKRYSESNKKRSEEEEREKRRNRNIKIAVGVGISLVGIALYAYGANKLHRREIQYGSDALKKIIDDNDLMNRPYDSNNGFFLKRDPKKRSFDNIRDAFLADAKEVNKEFNKQKGSRNNCGFCSVTYDLRRRGYDVYANKSIDGSTVTHISGLYKNAKVQDSFSFMTKDEKNVFRNGSMVDKISKQNDINTRVIDGIVSQGEGARGIFCGSYLFGGGHSMSYEVHDGMMSIVDAQVGKVYQGNDLETLLTSFDSGSFRWFRTDNIDIDKEGIKEAVHNIGTNPRYIHANEHDSMAANEYRDEILSLVRKGMSLSKARQKVNKKHGTTL